MAFDPNDFSYLPDYGDQKELPDDPRALAALMADAAEVRQTLEEAIALFPLRRGPRTVLGEKLAEAAGDHARIMPYLEDPRWGDRYATGAQLVNMTSSVQALRRAILAKLGAGRPEVANDLYPSLEQIAQWLDLDEQRTDQAGVQIITEATPEGARQLLDAASNATIAREAGLDLPRRPAPNPEHIRAVHRAIGDRALWRERPGDRALRYCQDAPGYERLRIYCLIQYQQFPTANLARQILIELAELSGGDVRVASDMPLETALDRLETAYRGDSIPKDRPARVVISREMGAAVAGSDERNIP